MDPVTQTPDAPRDDAPAGPVQVGPTTAGGWVKENWLKLVVVAVVVAVVSKYLHPLDLLLAGGGLSLIIFLHELGHFAAAKLCDVHVKTFSIGFGPAVPFCQFKYGETTYKLAMIPLGGFVAMVGEGEEEGDTVEAAATPEEAAADPRSFKNKPVWQRMVIISAGVVMNLILACVCFVATYLHGVQERPAIVTTVTPGSAAWRAGLQTGTEITRIDNRQDPWFNDLQPIVSSTRAGRTVSLDLTYAGTNRTLAVEPTRTEGSLLPLLGVSAPSKMVLVSPREGDGAPYLPGSAAAESKGANGGPGFLPGDEVVAMTDPDRPGTVTPLAADPAAGLPTPFFDYERRLLRLAANPATADKPVTFHVVRRPARGETAGPPVTVTAPLGHRWDTGLRMRMGEVVAVRAGSPADGRVQPQQVNADGKVTARGDRIVKVTVTGADGKPADLPPDPIRLPFELARWAEGKPADRTVTLTVLRDGEGHTDERKELKLTWDPAYQYDLTHLSAAGDPLPLGGLGLAYHALAVVDSVVPGSAAAAAGLQPNDKITKVQFKAADPAGNVKDGKWEDVGAHQWAFADYTLQAQAPHEFNAKVERAGQTLDVTLKAAPDPSAPVADLGLGLLADTRTQQAGGIGEALEMGAYRTTRSIRTIYQQLYALATGRISVKMMSGPISLARISYVLAQEDVWHLILFMGLVSVNLAVVNFLPIPVLDGGHMMFLLYEGVRGKPAPEWAHVGLTYAGLAVVGCLMLFVLGLDVWRLVFA